MKLEHKVSKIRVAYRQRTAWIATIISVAIMGSFFYYFSDYALVAGNQGIAHANVLLISQYIITGLFGLNIGLLACKLVSASRIKQQTVSSSAIGSILGILVTGCPSCSIGLASFLGLSAIFTALPFAGLEINALAVGILLYSTDNLAKTVNTCEVKI